MTRYKKYKPIKHKDKMKLTFQQFKICLPVLLVFIVSRCLLDSIFFAQTLCDTKYF
jgi:hypothetical protein